MVSEGDQRVMMNSRYNVSVMGEEERRGEQGERGRE